MNLPVIITSLLGLIYYVLQLLKSLTFNPIIPKISFINSPYYLLYNSGDVSLKNLVLNQLKIL